VIDSSLKPLRNTSSSSNIDTKIEEVVSSIATDNNKNSDSLQAKNEKDSSNSDKLDLLVAKVRETDNNINTNFLFSYNGGMLKRNYKYSSMEDLQIYNQCMFY